MSHNFKLTTVCGYSIPSPSNVNLMIKDMIISNNKCFSYIVTNLNTSGRKINCNGLSPFERCSSRHHTCTNSHPTSNEDTIKVLPTKVNRPSLTNSRMRRKKGRKLHTLPIVGWFFGSQLVVHPVVEPKFRIPDSIPSSARSTWANRVFVLARRRYALHRTGPITYMIGINTHPTIHSYWSRQSRCRLFPNTRGVD